MVERWPLEPIVEGSNPPTPAIPRGNMKPAPFLRLNVGDIFNDIDGTTFIKTGKCFIQCKEDVAAPAKELNCVILIPNKPKDSRGQIRFKDDDVYCEVFDDKEISELQIEHPDEVAKSDE